MKFIYPIGDSHTCMFQGIYRKPGTAPTNHSNVRFVYIGGVSSTAYNLSDHDSEVMELLSFMIFSHDDEIWFIFGEIDVRFQVFYQHQKLGITLDQSINDTVVKYTEYVKTLIGRGYPIKIVSITPTQLGDVPHDNDPQRKLTMLNATRGEGITLNDRIYITKELNKQIQDKCKTFGIGFIDLYPYLVDSYTGCIKRELCKDEGMHCYYIGDLVIDWFNLGNGDSL